MAEMSPTLIVCTKTDMCRDMSVRKPMQTAGHLALAGCCHVIRGARCKCPYTCACKCRYTLCTHIYGATGPRTAGCSCIVMATPARCSYIVMATHCRM